LVPIFEFWLVSSLNMESFFNKKWGKELMLQQTNKVTNLHINEEKSLE
jgi:hypothetical protein